MVVLQTVMPKSARTWTPVRETAQQWMDRIGYCLHVPTCSDSEACKHKRELERARTPQPAVYRGQTASNRKLDLG